MLTATITTITLAAVSFASPVVVKRTSGPTDIEILQYALTLEHLENNFYAGALAKYNASDFAAAGFNSSVYKSITQISEHEAEHVAFLTAAIGVNATEPCNYTFPYTDLESFFSLSSVLEGVGVSAYLGALRYISSKTYLTAAASILTTEARHAAFVQSSGNNRAPWSGAFDVPLDFDEVYSLAATFISNCPSTNPTLPVKAFPTLETSSNAAPGANITLAYSSSNKTEYLALFTGLTQVFVPITNFRATIPSNLNGTVYAVVTTNNTFVTDDSTVAGPGVYVFPDNE